MHEQLVWGGWVGLVMSEESSRGGGVDRSKHFTVYVNSHASKKLVLQKVHNGWPPVLSPPAAVMDPGKLRRCAASCFWLYTRCSLMKRGRLSKHSVHR